MTQLTKEFIVMDRISEQKVVVENRDDEIVELGVASVETKGAVPGILEGEGNFPADLAD